MQFLRTQGGTQINPEQIAKMYVDGNMAVANLVIVDSDDTLWQALADTSGPDAAQLVVDYIASRLSAGEPLVDAGFLAECADEAVANQKALATE